MPLRQAYANALRFVRKRKGLNQLDLGLSVDASHVSRLEASQSSVTLETSEALADAMQIHPLTLLALSYAAKQSLPPQDVLRLVNDDLQRLDFLDADVTAEGAKSAHPLTAKGMETTQAVQELKAAGMKQAEVARELQLSTSTVGRHWNRALPQS